MNLPMFDEFLNEDTAAVFLTRTRISLLPASRLFVPLPKTDHLKGSTCVLGLNTPIEI
jgi:hypothetical protein